MPCYEQQQGEDDNASFCQPLPEKESFDLPFNSPKVDMKGDFVPRGRWCYQQHWEMEEHLCWYGQPAVCCLVCGAGCDNN